MAWLSGWGYRKAVTLSRASGAVTNYQMKLLVGESSGAIGEDVDCGGKCQAGFHDIRFTKSDGTTLLDYWIEDITGTSPNQLATIWIEFDSIGTDATTFYMYYGGRPLPDPIEAPSTSKWMRYGSNPVLAVGAAGKWDDFWVQMNSIWKEGSTYYGYYQGGKSDGLFRIGLATSTDGISWTKNAAADGKIFDVGTGGAWDDSLVGYPCVWKEGSTWYMLYSGKNATSGKSQIGLATSSDGISWTRSGSNPVITNGLSMDTHIMQPGTRMLKEGDTYYFYYWGNTVYNLSENAKIMLATSTDLTTWTKSANNPMLSGGGTSAWDTAVLAPTVIKFGSTYYMFYEGAAFDGGNYNISRNGMASSANKDSGWSKHSGNPIIGIGHGTEWDNKWTEVAVLVNTGTEWRMYYGGSKGSPNSPRNQVGLAVYKNAGNGPNTFIAFDDFERVPGADPGGIWTKDASAATISDDQSYSGLGGRSCKLVSGDIRAALTPSENIAIRWRLWKDGTQTQAMIHGDGTKAILVRVIDTEVLQYYNGSAYVNVGSITHSVWQLLEVSDIKLGTSLDIWLNGVRILNDGACNWNYTGYANQMRFTGLTATCYIDHVLARHFRPVEPAWGSWEAEEGAAFEYEGSVNLQLSPPSIYALHRVFRYDGFIEINLIPSSEYTVILQSYEGEVSIHLVPQSDTKVTRVYRYEGSLNLSLIPQSEIHVIRVYRYEGILYIPLTLQSEIRVIGVYRYEGSIPLELAVVGDYRQSLWIEIRDVLVRSIIRASRSITSTPVLKGRNPMPGQTAVERNRMVEFLLACADGDEIDLDNVAVTIGGVLYGIEDPEFSYSGPVDRRLISVAHPVFDYEKRVDVVVEANSKLGGSMEPEAYHYTTEWHPDLTREK